MNPSPNPRPEDIPAEDTRMVLNRMASRRGILLGASAVAFTGFLAACAAPETPPPATQPTLTGPPKRGGTLKVGAPSEVSSLDPVTMFHPTPVGIVQMVGEYLIWLDEDYSLVPQLAQTWSEDKTNRVWTFQLRDGVTFSDGTPMDVHAVKASFDRLLDPKNRSAALSAFTGILTQGGVKVGDDSSVVFTLQREYADFPYLVSAGNYNAVILKRDYAGDFTEHPVGTGPFLLTSYDPSTGATLVRNPTYWQDGKPYLDGVDVRFYSDAQAEQIALQSGDLDTLIVTDPSLIVASGDIAIDQVSSTIMTAFTMRVDQPPFDKKEVRQAVAYALDRPAINLSTNDNLGAIANDHPFAPMFNFHPTHLPQRKQDRNKVKQLLAAAGVDRLEFALTFDPPSRNYALVIQDQLRSCGIHVTLDEQSSAAFYGGDQSTDTPWLFTPANLVGWAGRPVPSQFINPMVTTTGIWNGSKYSNPRVDEALNAYDAVDDEGTRRQQAEIIASALYEDVPVIVSLWQGAVRAYNRTRFFGIRAHASSYVDFGSVSRL